MNKATGITPAASDNLLLRAIREEFPQQEGLDWGCLTSQSRKREYTDARKRVTGLYYELSEVGGCWVLADLLDRDRTTILYFREQHPALLYDTTYRRKYNRLRAAVENKYEELITEYQTQTTDKDMFTSTISGNLGRDAEIVTLRDRNYYKLNLAIKGKSREDAATWVQILYYKTDGSKLSDLLLSGASVVAQGRLEVKPYIKRDGSAGVDITLWADTLEVTKIPEQKPEVAAEIIEDIPEDGDIF